MLSKECQEIYTYHSRSLTHVAVYSLYSL